MMLFWNFILAMRQTHRFAVSFVPVVLWLPVLAFLLLYYGIYNGALLAERPLSPVQIYCHRGLSSEAPENSLEAIDLAISSLSDGVEIDVQETKDGVVIVCHDASLKRIAGKNQHCRCYL